MSKRITFERTKIEPPYIFEKFLINFDMFFFSFVDWQGPQDFDERMLRLNISNAVKVKLQMLPSLSNIDMRSTTFNKANGKLFPTSARCYT